MFLGGVYLPRTMLPEVLIRDRRLHAARRPGSARCLAGDVAAARPARGHGPDHGDCRHGRRTKVPMGMSGSPASGSPAPTRVVLRDVVGPADRLVPVRHPGGVVGPGPRLLDRDHRRAPGDGGSRRDRGAVGVLRVHPGAAAAAGASPVDGPVLHRPAGDRRRAGNARLPVLHLHDHRLLLRHGPAAVAGRDRWASSRRRSSSTP